MTSPGGVRFWENLGSDAATTILPHSSLAGRANAHMGRQPQQTQQHPQAQQQHRSISSSVQDLVFGDFSPEDLKTMRLNQVCECSHHPSMFASCQTEQRSPPRDSNADAAAASWWGSLTGAPGPCTSQQERDCGTFNLAQAAAQWSEALLPGVVFASDWTAQHDAQTHTRSTQRAPRDLLERCQKAGNKQKLA